MKKTIVVAFGALLVLPFITGAMVHASPCTLTVSPKYAPLATIVPATFTLSGPGMSGSFVIPIGVNYTNTVTVTLPGTRGSCSASLYGTSSRQP